MPTSTVISMRGAYGRVYTTAKTAQADWIDGKDFMITDGPDTGRYCSIRDTRELMAQGYKQVIVRLAEWPYMAQLTLE